MHTNNFGRLRKKNKLYFDINPTMESLNYTTEAPEELDKGEIVIIDNEDVITPDDYYKYKGYFDDYDIEDYEEKYMKEKTYKIV